MAWHNQRLRLALSVTQHGEARLRTILVHSGDLSWMFDCAAAQWLYISPAFAGQFGYSSAEQHVIAQQLLRNLPMRITRLRAGDESRRRMVQRFDQIHKNGSLIPVEVVSTLLLDAAGEPDMLLGVVHNVSARRAQEQEYQRFAAMLSHEFRSPLAIIGGAVSLLQMTAGAADENRARRYRKIEGAVERLLALLDEYLSPERMASLGRALAPNQIRPRDLLEGALKQAGSSEHDITLHLSGLPAHLRCDPDGMRLCLQVLLDNAIKYTPSGTRVELLARPACEGGIEIIVQDEGPGVVEEDLPYLFDQGFRGLSSENTRGSGLGLYLAQTVLEAHGGTLTAANRTGGGAAFRIWLPGAIEVVKNLASKDCKSDNVERTHEA